MNHGNFILSNANNKHIPYGEWLSSLKEELFLICDNEYNATHTKFTEIKKFSQYEDNEKLMEYARPIITEYKIKTILGKSECDILRCAQLRDEFILHGQSYTQALPYRNKVVMKNILHSQNIPVAHYCEPKALNDAIAFAEIHGFPLILKPKDGSGSLNTLKLNNPSDLFQVSSFANTILEEFIDGKMYHVDGLYLNHELIFASPSVYETGCLEFQNKKSLKSHTLHIDNKLFTRLIDFTQRVIKALPSLKNMAFHAEIFHTLDDNLILCEIASRSGGGKIRQVIEHSYGINID
ncbi:ATP-grasp domain-containing protein [Fluviispira vulneris]|uniref:ATP-grasp domain-containing protein n=1 Tax=Fluviispira vulneris TaxID=2763012 RepID=UPI0016440AF9|nr:carboxylate--amine ligase [Fluviispira vulneris]